MHIPCILLARQCIKFVIDNANTKVGYTCVIHETNKFLFSY